MTRRSQEHKDIVEAYWRRDHYQIQDGDDVKRRGKKQKPKQISHKRGEQKARKKSWTYAKVAATTPDQMRDLAMDMFGGYYYCVGAKIEQVDPERGTGSTTS